MNANVVPFPHPHHVRSCPCRECSAAKASLRYRLRLMAHRLHARWIAKVDLQDRAGLVFLLGSLWGSFLTILALLAVAGWRA